MVEELVAENRAHQHVHQHEQQHVEHLQRGGYNLTADPADTAVPLRVEEESHAEDAEDAIVKNALVVGGPAAVRSINEMGFDAFFRFITDPGFETCVALSTWNVGCWDAKHISKHGFLADASYSEKMERCYKVCCTGETIRSEARMTMIAIRIRNGQFRSFMELPLTMIPRRYKFPMKKTRHTDSRPVKAHRWSNI